MKGCVQGVCEGEEADEQGAHQLTEASTEYRPGIRRCKSQVPAEAAAVIDCSAPEPPEADEGAEGYADRSG